MPKLLTRLIEELGSDQFATRQKANQELGNMDEQSAPALRKALGEPPQKGKTMMDAAQPTWIFIVFWTAPWFLASSS